MNEVLPMKKIILLLVPALSLVACNDQNPKYDIRELAPYKEVIFPDAKDITEGEALSLTSNLVTEYDFSSDKSSIQRDDYEFKYEIYELLKIQENLQSTRTRRFSTNYRLKGATETYFREGYHLLTPLNVLGDTVLIHKQTKKYGNVTYIKKRDRDLDYLYTLVNTEKYTPYTTGSMMATISIYSHQKMEETYNSNLHYEEFFEFIKDTNFTHSVKYASRGKGSLIMETTSTAINPGKVNDLPCSKVTIQMEYFENILMNYEYIAYDGETIIKNEKLSISYERPEIEFPSGWENRINNKK